MGWSRDYIFVLVGATVDLRYLKSAGGTAVLLLLLVLLFRMSGVFLCLAGTDLTKKERLFCMIAYTPKATVQAAIGGILSLLDFPAEISSSPLPLSPYY